jgi:hypoxanthine phosphoribosyltransferase
MKLLFKEAEIKKTVKQIAKKLATKSWMKKNDVVLVCNLKGATWFFSDLSKELGSMGITPYIEFAQTSSYKDETTSSEKVEIKRTYTDFDIDIKDKYVIIVDDIMDTGRALCQLRKSIKQGNPKEVILCVLINKTARREGNVKPEVAGLNIQDGYIVGYGLAVGDTQRCLKDIYVL